MTKRITRPPGTYKELRLLAEMFADAQEVRVAFENKLGRSAAGKERKNVAAVDAETFGPALAHYKNVEDDLGREMVACYQVTVPEPVRRWQAASAGIGEHTLARLLGVTGDPRTAYPMHWEGEGSARVLVEDEPAPRGVGRLWQYCGVGAPKNRAVKGDARALLANGQPDAKKLTYLLALAQVKSSAKSGAAYRGVYDEAKARYTSRLHTRDCEGGFFNGLYVKCKTHPVDTAGQFYSELGAREKTRLGYALAGDPYQKSHVHVIALRLTGKEILRDLWLTAGGDEPVYGTVRVGEENRGRHRLAH